MHYSLAITMHTYKSMHTHTYYIIVLTQWVCLDATYSSRLRIENLLSLLHLSMHHNNATAICVTDTYHLYTCRL